MTNAPSHSRIILAHAMLAVLAELLCLCFTRISLDLFFSGLFLAALFAPLYQRNFIWIAITAGISIVWISAVATHSISIAAWFECSLVLLTFAAMLAAANNALSRLRIAPLVASAIVTTTSLLWLTWPLWLGAAGPVSIHPLFAINSACRVLGIWTEQQIAYHLTSLGQDIPYRLPRTIIPCILVQSTIAASLIVFNKITLKQSPQT